MFVCFASNVWAGDASKGSEARTAAVAVSQAGASQDEAAAMAGEAAATAVVGSMHGRASEAGAASAAAGAAQTQSLITCTLEQ